MTDNPTIYFFYPNFPPRNSTILFLSFPSSYDIRMRINSSQKLFMADIHLILSRTQSGTDIKIKGQGRNKQQTHKNLCKTNKQIKQSCQCASFQRAPATSATDRRKRMVVHVILQFLGTGHLTCS
ncbi:hypothetical protein CDAR_571661 [Caerostris darwini]|uniref:Uncharacterized protein n=1 Tax=Caerostris darwini TaxID=1538125 RepID=A0AAV4WF05_9ARAC|nr:hypothetical protein CDAR_571661 [Caerostris darwini]